MRVDLAEGWLYITQFPPRDPCVRCRLKERAAEMGWGKRVVCVRRAVRRQSSQGRRTFLWDHRPVMTLTAEQMGDARGRSELTLQSSVWTQVQVERALPRVAVVDEGVKGQSGCRLKYFYEPTRNYRITLPGADMA